MINNVLCAGLDRHGDSHACLVHRLSVMWDLAQVNDQQGSAASDASSGSTVAVTASIGIVLCTLLVILIAFIARRRADRSVCQSVCRRCTMLKGA